MISVGTSDSGGTLALSLTPGTYNVTAGYQHTKAVQTGIVLGAEGLQVDFATTEARVKVQNSFGEPLANVSLSYHASSSYPTFGKTDENGIAARELFAGTYGIQAGYKGTRSGYIPVEITRDGIDHVFKTTRVQFNHSGVIDYLGSDHSYYRLSDGKQPGEMFPGEYKFFFGGSVKPQFTRILTIGQDPISLNFALVTLKSSTGKGLAGGVVSYYAGGWVSSAAVTDETGTAVLALPGGKSATAVALDYKGGRVQLNQRMSENPVFSFTTVPVSVKLISSTGNALSGAVSHYGTATGGWLRFGDNGEGAANTSMEMLEQAYTFQMNYKGALQNQKVTVSGATEVTFTTRAFTFKLLDSAGAPLSGTANFYAGKWQPFGDNGEGETNAAMELLPVEHTFEVIHNGARQQRKINVADASEVLFQTGRVTIRFASGKLTFYTTKWFTYTEPVELLPVEIKFYFEGGGFPKKTQPITPVAGQSLEYTIAYARLLGSGGQPVEGGKAQYYDGAWRDLGMTGADGTCFGMLAGNKAKSLSFSMTLGGTTAKQTQDLSESSFITFNSVGVVVQLLSSTGEPLDGAAQYYAGGWKTIPGRTPAALELMPGTYSFGVGYKGASIQKSQDISLDPVVVFQTVPVTVTLTSSTNEPLTANAAYYAGGWRSLGKTGTPAELLPGSYPFEVNYLGARVQKTQDVAADGAVRFETVLVSFNLLDGHGTPLEAAAKFYAGGWKTFGSGKTGSTMEMLPTGYPFEATYQKKVFETTQNVGEDPAVVIWAEPPIPAAVKTGAQASASVNKIPGSTNELTIAVTELYSDGTAKVYTDTFTIQNNAADTYTVGAYRVYVNTKGNTKIRECRIVV